MLHGPPAHAPVIKYVVDMCSVEQPTQDNQFYNIMIIFTRGMISDLQDVTDQIVRASHQPVSLIIVGLGKNNDGKFDKLKNLDGEDTEEEF